MRAKPVNKDEENRTEDKVKRCRVKKERERENVMRRHTKQVSQCWIGAIQSGERTANRLCNTQN